jgi:hypothetical protein
MKRVSDMHVLLYTQAKSVDDLQVYNTEQRGPHTAGVRHGISSPNNSPPLELPERRAV